MATPERRWGMIVGAVVLIAAAVWVGWVAEDYLDPSPLGQDVTVHLSAHLSPATSAIYGPDYVSLFYGDVSVFKYDEENGSLEIRGHRIQTGGRSTFYGEGELRHDIWPPGSILRVEIHRVDGEAVEQ